MNCNADVAGETVISNLYTASVALNNIFGSSVAVSPLPKPAGHVISLLNTFWNGAQITLYSLIISVPVISLYIHNLSCLAAISNFSKPGSSNNFVVVLVSKS